MLAPRILFWLLANADHSQTPTDKRRLANVSDLVRLFWLKQLATTNPNVETSCREHEPVTPHAGDAHHMAYAQPQPQPSRPYAWQYRSRTEHRLQSRSRPLSPFHFGLLPSNPIPATFHGTMAEAVSSLTVGEGASTQSVTEAAAMDTEELYLSDELLLHVMSFLSSADLFRCRAVCRQWRRGTACAQSSSLLTPLPAALSVHRSSRASRGVGLRSGLKSSLAMIAATPAQLCKNAPDNSLLTSHRSPVVAVDKTLLRRFKWEMFARSKAEPKSALAAKLKGHQAIVRALSFYRHFLLSASDDTHVRVWDTTTLLPGLPEPPGVAGAPPGPDRHPCVLVLRAHKSRVQDMLVSGQDLFTCSYDHTIRRWDLPSLLEAVGTACPPADQPTAAVEPLLHEPDAVLRGHRDGVVSLACHEGRLFSGTYVVVSAERPPQRRAGFLDVCHVTHPSPHSPRRRNAGSSDGTVREWVNDTMEHCMLGHTSGVTSIALRVAGDMQQLCSTSLDKSVRIWRVDAALPDRVCTHVLQGHLLIVDSCAPVPGGFLSGGFEATIRLWDTVVVPPNHAGALERADGHGSAIGADTAYVASLHHHERPVLSMLRPRDSPSHLIFTGSHDCRVCVWQAKLDARSAESDGDAVAREPRTVGADLLMSIDKAHDGGVSALAWRNGRLYTGAWDKTIRVWDPPTRQALPMADGETGAF